MSKEKESSSKESSGREESIVTRDQLVCLEQNAHTAAEVAYRLLLLKDSATWTIQFQLAQIHRLLTAALARTQALSLRLIESSEQKGASTEDRPRVLLYWGPEMSGKTDAALEFAMMTDSEFHTDGEWDARAGVHHCNVSTEDEATMAALAFRDGGQGTLIIEFESSIPPSTTSAFDEVLGFPVSSRS